MFNPKKSSVDEILRKYGRKIENQISTTPTGNYSREYEKFKDELAPEITKYERWCRSLGSVIHFRVSEKDYVEIEKNLIAAHLEVNPSEALALSVMAFVSVFLIGILVSVAVILINGSLASFPVLFFFLMLMFSMFLFYFVKGYPGRLANQWRLKASSQMVPAVLYVVVYMRHTPNLEKAIAFASQHLQYPLALDFKKVFYDVEIGRFSTIKESLDNYLERWREHNPEFIESFHLIESSLFEPDENRRISILEKSLQVILDGVYDRMLKFSHEVRSPLNNVYMFTTVLPVLGIALLPLASAMIGDFLRWYHVLIVYNLIIPFAAYYLTDKILYQRPGGYGESALLERNPSYYKYKSNAPFFPAFLIAFPFLILGLLPLLFLFFFNGVDFSFSEIGFGILGKDKLFNFIQTSAGTAGPFGIGALLLSMFIPLGVAMFFSTAYIMKTREIIGERENTRKLEMEFNNSLFQLGNRVGNGVPLEIAFGKVAESAKGLMTEDFFRRVNYNIRQNGMSVEKAIFDSRRGAINYFPSDLIATSMRILIEASKKGLKIAAVSLMSISEYVKNIQKITNRLRDLLAEIISEMKSNMTFLAPLLSGIVVGLAGMITTILSKLNLADLNQQGTALGNFETLLSIFSLSKMIPPYFLQISIGIYIIEVIFILTRTLVAIDAGEDKLQRINSIGKNLRAGIMLYFLTALIATIALFFLSSVVLGNLI